MDCRPHGRQTRLTSSSYVSFWHFSEASLAASEGRDTDALREYRAALEADAASTEALRAIAALAEKTGAADEAGKALLALLAVGGDALAAQERASIYARLGGLRRAAGDADAAINFYEKAAQAGAPDRALLDTLADLYRAREDWNAVVRVLRALASLGDREDGYRAWMEVGDLLCEKLGDRVRATEAYRKATDARPKGFMPLHRLLELATERRDWPEALDVLARLASIEEDRERRAKYWYSAAVILRDEIGDESGAVDKFEKTLDDDSQRAKAFAAIKAIWQKRGRAVELGRAYERQIQRLGDAPATVEARAQLWHDLGLARREELGDLDGAIAALEEAARLDPAHLDRGRLLAEIYVETGPERLGRAIEAAHAQIRLDPYRLEGWRLLERLYDERGQPERADRVAAALALLGRAVRTSDRVDEAAHATGCAPPLRRRVDQELFERCIRHPDQDPCASAVFAAIAQVGATMTARPPEAYGLAGLAPLDLASDDRPLSRALRDVAPLLGVPLPPLYLDEAARGLRLANPRNGAGAKLALVAGIDVACAEGETESLFEAARGLALVRPESLLAWAVPLVPALRGLFWGAARLVRDDLAAPAGVPEVERIAAHLRSRLPPDAIAAIAKAVGELDPRAEPDLGRWLGAVELTAARAALAITGDLVVAARIVASDPPGRHSLSAKERLRELLLYAVSEAYFEADEHLHGDPGGVSVAGADDAASS